MEKTLVLTATITPPVNAHKLSRSDPVIRRQDYYSAFSHYLQTLGECFDRLIFAENSGSEVAEFLELASKSSSSPEVLVWSYDANDFPNEWGRAYGEFKLLDLVFRQLNPGPNDEFWKATGRVFISNIEEISLNSPKKFDLNCDCRYLPKIPVIWDGKRWMDMRLIGFGAEFYRNEVLGLQDQFRHDLVGTPEPYFYERVMSWRTRYRVECRFGRQPVLHGHAGYDNKDLASFRQRAIMHLRRFSRRFTPFVWI